MNTTSRINLLITVFDLHFGGISNLILQTTPALMKEMDIHVVYFGPKDEMLERYKNAEIRIFRIEYNGIKDLLRAGKQLANFIQSNRIHIVSTHLFVDKAITTVARRFAKFKVLSTLHSANNPYPSGNYRLYINNKLEDYFQNFVADKNFAVSEASLKSWKEHRNFKNKNTRILYSGIEKLPCRIPKSIDFERKKKIFVTACRFTKEKGLRRLITQFSELNSVNTNWEFWIIGSGFLFDEISILVKDLKLQKQVILKGFQTNLCHFYKEVDFYINGSFHEALPVSILEAMSIGIPIIGSKVGGIPEIVSHAENGYLVNFEDEKEALDILEKCINMSFKDYGFMSKNSQEIFSSKFSIDNYVKIFTEEMEVLHKTSGD